MSEDSLKRLYKANKTNRLKNISAAILAVLFATYIGMTIAFQYITYNKLNKTKDYQTQKEIEKKAATLNYFLIERQNDISELASDSRIQTYFLNQALGMSMQYGLKSSLLSIEHEFKRILLEKKYDNKPIYSNIIFANKQRDCLVKAANDNIFSDKCPVNEIYKNNGWIILKDNYFILSAEVFFNKEYAGDVFAWINSDFISDSFIKRHDETKTDSILFSKNGKIILSTIKNSNQVNSLILQNLHFFKKELSDKNFTGKQTEIKKYGTIKFFGTEIKNTDYYLLEIIKESHIKEQSPFFIISAMAILLIGVALVLIFWWRQNSRNFELNLKIHKFMTRKEIINEKNRELRKEIIKRRTAEKELNNYNKNLEILIKKRTSSLEKTLKRLKLAQSQLVQSEKLASIGQLSAGVAHEINNPLGFIKTNISVFRQYSNDLIQLISTYEKLENKSDKYENIIAEVKDLKEKMDFNFIMEDLKTIFDETAEGVERILAIVSDLKFFAHRETKEKTLTDVHQCINSTLNVIHNEIKYKAQVIKNFSEIPKIKCYPQRINQILTNLIINASQAIEKQGIIYISTYRENDYVVIKIKDTGSGIPAEIKDKIFDPFFSTKPVGKGTGLGLHVVYNNVKKHKGIIKVKSSANKGTSFTIYLPIDSDSHPKPA